MIRKWLAAAALSGVIASAWAAVDVNTANESALVGIRESARRGPRRFWTNAAHVARSRARTTSHRA
jgi:hypothetical protein